MCPGAVAVRQSGRRSRDASGDRMTAAALSGRWWKRVAGLVGIRERAAGFRKQDFPVPERWRMTGGGSGPFGRRLPVRNDLRRVFSTEYGAGRRRHLLFRAARSSPGREGTGPGIFRCVRTAGRRLGRSGGVGGLFGDGRHVGHRSSGGRLLFGLDAPCANVGVPAAVVLARLDVHGDGVGRALPQPGHVVGLVEERHADLAGERTFVHLENHVLTLPFAACRGSLRHGHYFVDGSFEFHISAFCFVSAKIQKNRNGQRRIPAMRPAVCRFRPGTSVVVRFRR